MWSLFRSAERKQYKLEHSDRTYGAIPDGFKRKATKFAKGFDLGGGGDGGGQEVSAEILSPLSHKAAPSRLSQAKRQAKPAAGSSSL